MMDKVKEYFNGSMELEPEPASGRKEQATDMDLAGRFFQTFGIICVIVGAFLVPATGGNLTTLLFGILFIGISIVLKAQDQILQRLSGAVEAQRQSVETAEQGEERNESFL